MYHRKVLRGACALATILMLSSPAQAAGLFRAYLTSTGNDANPCTLPQPCRLLPAALTAVADGGEIWMLDSGNFNTAPVTIAKGVTILAIPGVLGSVVGNGGDALVVNGAVGRVVSLRNLKILNLSGGANGVNMTTGGTLFVENCVVTGFSASGIRAAGAVTVNIVDSLVRNNSAGVVLDTGVTAHVARSHFLDNDAAGIYAAPTTSGEVTVHVSDSVSSGNGYGFWVNSYPGFTARMYLTRTVASGNGSGFAVGGANGSMAVSASTAARNSQYGLLNDGGSLRSRGDNIVVDNLLGDTYGTISALGAM